MLRATKHTKKICFQWPLFSLGAAVTRYQFCSRKEFQVTASPTTKSRHNTSPSHLTRTIQRDVITNSPWTGTLGPSQRVCATVSQWASVAEMEKRSLEWVTFKLMRFQARVGSLRSQHHWRKRVTSKESLVLTSRGWALSEHLFQFSDALQQAPVHGALVKDSLVRRATAAVSLNHSLDTTHPRQEPS